MGQAHTRKVAHTPVQGMTFLSYYLIISGGMEDSMEIVEQAVNIINQVGFPIACVVAMFWQMEKEREAHSAESAQWVDAINRNTNVIEKLTDKLS